MAITVSYRLEPQAAFHFGSRGLDLEETAETFRSDAFYSALATVIREGWGAAALAEWIAAGRAPDPPFRLSSGFPYAGPIRFYPRPMLPLPVDPGPEAGKRLKSVRYVSERLFRRWLNGRLVADDLAAEAFLASSHAWLDAADRAAIEAALPGEPADPAGDRRPARIHRSTVGARPARPAGSAGPLWQITEVPRVTVDRLTAASAVYRCGRLTFRPGCGLHVLVDWRDESFRPRFEEALRVLGDAGIGGRRSTGHGQFRPLPPDPIDRPDADLAVDPGRDGVAVAGRRPATPSDRASGGGSVGGGSVGGGSPGPDHVWVTLALYSPTPAELAAGILNDPARYDLTRRGGWLGSPAGMALRRRDLRLITEGSVLAPVVTPTGALVEVTPAGFSDHPVYRAGLAFPVAARRPEVDDA